MVGQQIDPQWAWSKYQPGDHQPWNRRRAAHLFRRAGFGASDAQLDQAVQQGVNATVQLLLNPGDTAQFDQQMKQAGQLISSGQEARRLSSWWLLRMTLTPHPLLEKMTLFWHGHFATSGAKVADARAMLAQNDILRQHALSRFPPLVQAIARDVAMLIYLDSTDNRKTRPNENFARELMELFCLGPGNFSENDIKEIARCFTGWEVRRKQFRFNPYQHDSRSKSFFGQSGDFGGEQAIEAVLQQPAAPRFVAKKLIRLFVADETTLDDSLVEPLARQLRANDFDVRGAVEMILTSQWFYSDHSVAAKIRSPVELAIGLIRAAGISTNMDELSNRLEALGQLPFFPPNVKGWEGGRRWINASTLLGRANLARELVLDGQPAHGSLQNWAQRHGKNRPEELVDWLVELMVAGNLPQQSRLALVQTARDSDNDPSTRIANTISVLATYPEFQLA